MGREACVHIEHREGAVQILGAGVESGLRLSAGWWPTLSAGLATKREGRQHWGTATPLHKEAK